jgi:hypothetical protein
MLEDMIERIKNNEGTPDDIKSKKFILLAQKLNAEAKHVQKAYFKLCGVEDIDSEDTISNKLYREMKEMSDNGFPINRFAEIIESRQDFEQAIPDYLKYINSLPLSEKEIQVLYSIVTKQRKGELEIFIDNENFASIKINTDKQNKNASALVIKSGLERVLKQIPKKGKISISFSED